MKQQHYALRWHQAVLSGEPQKIEQLLDDSISLHTPVYWKARTGKQTVSLLLATAFFKVFENFTYHRSFYGDDSCAMEFSANIGDSALRGVDIINWGSEGFVTRFEVMMRPPNALKSFQSRMEQSLT